MNEGLLSSLFEILNSGEDLNSNSNMDKKSSCYKTYQITNEGDMVTIKISTEFNLVGLTTWEGRNFEAE